MGWMYCGTDSHKRPIGYGVEATCDYPGCQTRIDRGLAYACGGMHGDCGGNACEGYYCADHLMYREDPEMERYQQFCPHCAGALDWYATQDGDPDYSAYLAAHPEAEATAWNPPFVSSGGDA